LLIVLCLAGAGYGAVWALSIFAPEPSEIVKPVTSDRLNN